MWITDSEGTSALSGFHIHDHNDERHDRDGVRHITMLSGMVSV